MPNMKKKMSKRVSCRQRYKVEKKVRQHLKKKKEGSEKEPEQTQDKGSWHPQQPSLQRRHSQGGSAAAADA
ncbi:hypothetical protein MTO96_047735 [Rhipicephalus appendiculatus]